jgi:hypothetical protein
MLTLRPSKIGPPVYAHLADYDVLEDGQSIGRIMEQREPVPGREWFWSLTITGAHQAGVVTSGYAAASRMPRRRFALHSMATGLGQRQGNPQPRQRLESGDRESDARCHSP